MIKVNGVALPTPSSLTVSVFDIYDSTDRDSTGTIHLDYIATKHKLECAWNFLTQEQMTMLLNAIRSISLTVAYIDPATGQEKVIEVYKGDRTIPVLDYVNNVMRYKDFKVNFIEL